MDVCPFTGNGLSWFALPRTRFRTITSLCLQPQPEWVRSDREGLLSSHHTLQNQADIWSKVQKTDTKQRQRCQTSTLLFVALWTQMRTQYRLTEAVCHCLSKEGWCVDTFMPLAYCICRSLGSVTGQLRVNLQSSTSLTSGTEKSSSPSWDHLPKSSI